jgi:hypothetical protein
MLDMAGDTAVVHVQVAKSDHCAILVRLQRTGWMHRHGCRRERPFRYENMWNCHETYESTVAAAWVPGCSSLEALHANLQGMQITLSD